MGGVGGCLNRFRCEIGQGDEKTLIVLSGKWFLLPSSGLDKREEYSLRPN